MKATEKREKELEQRFVYNPNECPFCGSDDLYESDFDGETAECICDECGKSWRPCYKLVGCIFESDDLTDD